MPYSVLVGDKVHDIVYKKRGMDGWDIQLNGRLLGTTFNLGKRSGWDVVVLNSNQSSTIVQGFISRDKVVSFLLETLGYHTREEDYITEYLIFKWDFLKGLNN
jgi:hypothetical protein